MKGDRRMHDSEKVIFYNNYQSIIHTTIKSDEITKPLWRRLYWTTEKNSDTYKVGCVTIFTEYFPERFSDLDK